MRRFFITTAILMLAASFTLKVNITSATVINFEQNSLEGAYTLSEGFWPPYENKGENILLAEELTNVTEYTRELKGYFTLPKYKGSGEEISGYLTGNFSIYDPAWFGDKFNYKHTFNLKTNEYHYENDVGTITDLRVNWDNDNNAYAFVYQQFMSQPDHPNWIAGFPSDAINTSLWFYESYKPHYDLIESGSVKITDAKISFSTANPVPEPTTIALLGSGIIGLMISKKKFRTKRR